MSDKNNREQNREQPGENKRREGKDDRDKKDDKLVRNESGAQQSKTNTEHIDRHARTHSRTICASR